MISVITGLIAGAVQVWSGPAHLAATAADMAEPEKRHGGTLPACFQDVRGVSLQQWLNFDRNTMFEPINEAASARL